MVALLAAVSLHPVDVDSLAASTWPRANHLHRSVLRLLNIARTRYLVELILELLGPVDQVDPQIFKRNQGGTTLNVNHLLLSAESHRLVDGS